MPRTVRLPARAKRQDNRQTANAEEHKGSLKRSVRVVRRKQTGSKQGTKPSNASTSRSVSVRKKCSPPKEFVPPVLPEKPKVTVGAKSYGRSRKGRYIVVRFFVTQWAPRKYTDGPSKSDPWFVIDLNDPKRYVARGTKQSGYPTKEKAIKVARRCRDEYGAWHLMPF